MSHAFQTGGRSSANISASRQRPSSALSPRPLEKDWQSQPFQERLNPQGAGAKREIVKDFTPPRLDTSPSARGWVQPKLRINPPNDRFEREADRVADRVAVIDPSLAAGNHAAGNHAAEGVSTTGGPAVQTKCADCEKKKEEEGKSVQRKAAGSAADNGADAPPSVESQVGASGGGMGMGMRSFMERQIGHDFGDVRIHTDGAAAESARAIDARAYTVGRDVVFGAGEYQPGTQEGRRLLAHELTHVVQQRGMSEGAIQREPCGQSDRFSGDTTWGHDILQWDYVLNLNPYPLGMREYEIPEASKQNTPPPGTSDAESSELTGVDIDPTKLPENGSVDPVPSPDPPKGKSKSGFADIVDNRSHEIYDFKPPSKDSQELGKKEVAHYVQFANIHCGGKWVPGRNYPGTGNPYRIVPDPVFPDIEWVATQDPRYRDYGVIKFWFRERTPEPVGIGTPEEIDNVDQKINERVRKPRRHPREIEKERKKKRPPGDKPHLPPVRVPIGDQPKDPEEEPIEEPQKPIEVPDTKPVREPARKPEPVPEPEGVWEELVNFLKQTWEVLKEFVIWLGEIVLAILEAIAKVILYILLFALLALVAAAALVGAFASLLIGLADPSMGSTPAMAFTGEIPSDSPDAPSLSEEGKEALDTLGSLSEELKLALEGHSTITPGMLGTASSFEGSIGTIYHGELPGLPAIGSPAQGGSSTDGPARDDSSGAGERQIPVGLPPGEGGSERRERTSTPGIVEVPPTDASAATKGSGEVSIATATTRSELRNKRKGDLIRVWCSYTADDGTIYRSNPPLMMEYIGKAGSRAHVRYRGEHQCIVPPEFAEKYRFRVIIWKEAEFNVTIN